MDTSPLMQTLVWTCTSCGFAIEGNQPHMECPVCEAYKTSFVDTPQHVEAAVRAKHKEPNTTAARQARLEALSEGGFLRSASFKGRRTKAVHGAGHSRTER